MDDINEPVLVVTDADGYLIEAGQPDCFKKSKIGDYAQKGYKIETITITEYRSKQWKWYWEKEGYVSGK